MYNNILLHTSFGKAYDLPVVISISADQDDFFVMTFRLFRLFRL